MAVATPVTLTKGGSAVGASSYATASVSVVSGRYYIIGFASRTGITADPTAPTATGAGLTISVEKSVVYDNTSSSRRRLTVFKALCSSTTSGAITFDESSQAQTNAEWIVLEIPSGFNTTGTVVQSVSNFDGSASVSSLTVTLAAFGSANNATMGFFADGDAATWTAGSGFTFTDSSKVNTNTGLFTEFRADNDTTVDATYSTNSELGVIGLEIKSDGSVSVSVAAGVNAGVFSIQAPTIVTHQAITASAGVNTAAFSLLDPVIVVPSATIVSPSVISALLTVKEPRIQIEDTGWVKITNQSNGWSKFQLIS